MTWIELPVSVDGLSLIAPCGCEFPNTFDGMIQAKEHTANAAPVDGSPDQPTEGSDRE